MRQSLIDFKMWLYKRYDFNIPNRYVDEYLAEKSIKESNKEANSCVNAEATNEDEKELYEARHRATLYCQSCLAVDEFDCCCDE